MDFHLASPLTSIAPLFAQDEALASSMNKLGNTPYIILALYLVLLLVLGIMGWLKSKAGEEDYYLAGRNQGWLVSSLTIMATFFSSFALLGAPGMVYREGVVFALFSLNVPVAGLCVYLLGVRIWRLGKAYGYVTPGDMIADYYGSRLSLRPLVALCGFLYAIPYVVMQIQAGGLITQELFPGKLLGQDSFVMGAILLSAITMLYIMIGGMRSVAWTDLIQGILLISGMLVSGFAMLLVFDGLGNFSKDLMTKLPESSLTSPGNTNAWYWTLIFSVCLLGSAGSMVQPAQWMRYYSARNARTLQRGAMVFAVVLTACFILGVMLIGLAGQILYPLHNGVTIEIAGGPATLEQQVPDELKANFRYISPKESDKDQIGRAIWSWPLKDGRRTASEAEIKQLAALSSNESYQQTISSLGTTLSDDDIKLMPHPSVDSDPTERSDFDAILVVVLNQNLPDVLGAFGTLFASLLIVSIMAASMSTADSNLHALSAVLTRDVYDQYIRPKATEGERVWIGRGIIVVATVLSLVLVIAGRNPEISAKYDFLNMIAKMGLMAIAFSAQMLPIAIDILFLRKGTCRGAAAGLAAGLFGAFLFGPLFQMFAEAVLPVEMAASILGSIGSTKGMLVVHGSVWGLLFNIPIFVLVSMMTKPVPEDRKQRFAEVMEGRAKD